MRVLSLGAGVQSTTLALMADAGEIERPDVAFFADTGWEPKAVYRHLCRLEKALSFPVERVSNGDIRDAITADEPGRYASVPFFLRNPDGSKGMGRRQCTHEYKIKPLNRAMRRWAGYGERQRIPAGAVEVMIGISTDEAARMKPARVQWQITRWPLIEARMSRSDCYAWLRRKGWEAPKSACVGCPFRSNAAWRDMRERDPESWADAVAVDRRIRSGGTQKEQGLKGKQYIHSSLLPLDQAPIADDRQGNLFVNECEGMCGV